MPRSYQFMSMNAKEVEGTDIVEGNPPSLTASYSRVESWDKCMNRLRSDPIQFWILKLNWKASESKSGVVDVLDSCSKSVLGVRKRTVLLPRFRGRLAPSTVADISFVWSGRTVVSLIRRYPREVMQPERASKRRFVCAFTLLHLRALWGGSVSYFRSSGVFNTLRYAIGRALWVLLVS